VLVAQSLAPIAFPLFPRLPADLASVGGLLFGDLDPLANGVTRVVHIEAQPAELFLHLQYFKLSSGFLLEFGDQWFQILA
jgi:hypothetical protein